MSNDDTDGAVNAEEKRKDHPEIKESKGVNYNSKEI